MAAMAEKHTHYRDYRDIRGDGRIILYRRADIQSPNWTARLKIPNTVGYVVKSTKTPDDFEARRFAEELYYQLEGRARRGEPVKSPTFKWVFEQWKASLSMDRKVRSAKYVDGNICRCFLRMRAGSPMGTIGQTASCAEWSSEKKIGLF
jgi:hypothetical protein